jgi:hypothetical protein
MIWLAYRERFPETNVRWHCAILIAIGSIMRRAQALLVILALLATPLAVVAGLNSCEQVACPLCAAIQHGKTMSCSCPMRHVGKCGSTAQTQLPDFALADAFAPTAPLPFFTVTAPATGRMAWTDFAPSVSHGFLSPPFAPPRS